MADQLTKEQLDDYKEAFTLFNQARNFYTYVSICIRERKNIYIFGLVKDIKVSLLYISIIGRNHYNFSFGNNYAVFRS